MKITTTVRFDLDVKYLARAGAIGLKFGAQEVSGRIETREKELVPVDTGRLRDSIHTEHSVDEPMQQIFTVQPGSEGGNEYGWDPAYARRIEHGFFGADRLGRVYNQAAQPFVRPAYDEEREAGPKTIKESVLDALDNAMATVSSKRRR